MNTYRVFLMPQAQADIGTIAEYIAKDNPARAVEYAIELQQKIKKVLSLFPHKHRTYKDTNIFVY